MRWVIVVLALVSISGIAVAESIFDGSILTVLLSEDFEGSFPPKDWQVLEFGNSGGVWKRNDEWKRENFAGNGYCACADSDRFGYEMETELRTPVIDLRNCIDAKLEFDTDFRNDDDLSVFRKGYAEILISSDGGRNWQTLMRWCDDRNGHVEIDLTPYIGKEVIIAWHYYGDGIYWWQLDNIKITAHKKQSKSFSPLMLMLMMAGIISAVVYVKRNEL
jgi:hypothetical protein